MHISVVLPRISRALTWILVATQLGLFDAFLVHHNSKRNLWWLVADGGVLLPLLVIVIFPGRFAELWKACRCRKRESTGEEQENDSKLDESRPFWLAWTLYILVLCGKVWHSFTSTIGDVSEDSDKGFGDSVLRSCLAITAAVFVTFVVGFHYGQLNDVRERRLHLYHICWDVALEVIDSAEFLEYFVERRELHAKTSCNSSAVGREPEHVSQDIEYAALVFVSWGLLLTALEVYQLGKRQWMFELYDGDARNDFSLHGFIVVMWKLILNGAFMIMRIYLLVVHEVTTSMLLVKNILVIGWLLWLIFYSHRQTKARSLKKPLPSSASGSLELVRRSTGTAASISTDLSTIDEAPSLPVTGPEANESHGSGRHPEIGESNKSNPEAGGSRENDEQALDNVW